MIGRLLCRLGLHHWTTVMVTDSEWPILRGHAFQRCDRCGRRWYL